MAYLDKEQGRRYTREWGRYVTMWRRAHWMNEAGPCRDCGTWEHLETHHVIPEPGHPNNIWTWSDERREAYLAKCIALCTVCHQRRHGKEIGHGTRKRYEKGCRCEPCREAKKAHRRKGLALGKRW